MPEDPPPDSRSRLGTGARFSGIAHSAEVLEITGVVEGQFSSDQSVEIHPPAEVRGEIYGQGLRVLPGADVEAKVAIGQSAGGAWWRRLWS